MTRPARPRRRTDPSRRRCSMARKRASMREGPLAELFGPTEAAQQQAARKEEPATEVPAAGPDEATAEHAPALEPVEKPAPKPAPKAPPEPPPRERPVV